MLKIYSQIHPVHQVIGFVGVTFAAFLHPPPDSQAAADQERHYASDDQPQSERQNCPACGLGDSILGSVVYLVSHDVRIVFVGGLFVFFDFNFGLVLGCGRSCVFFGCFQLVGPFFLARGLDSLQKNSR
jgi:hypothetical protein